MSEHKALKNRTKQEIKISLLLNDLKQAREFSDLFRQLGIVPAIYENLQDLWFDILKERPSLCIVDIRNLTQGDLLLQKHPAIQAGQLNLAFYYQKSFAPLLVSVGDIVNWGLISDDVPLGVQVKSILERINRFRELSYKYKQADRQVKKLEFSIDNVYRENQEVSKNLYYKTLANSWINQFDIYKKSENFYDFIHQAMDNFEEVKKFTILELSQSCQRLVSPQIPSYKFIDIPSIWLGKMMNDGVDFYGENMANQVLLDLIGGKQITIPLYGSKEGVEVFVSILLEGTDEVNEGNAVNNKELAENMPWGELSNYLSSMYRMYQLKDSKTTTALSNELNPWEFSDLVSNYYFSHFEMESVDLLKAKSMISLNFGDLIENATAKNYTKFYWKKFQKDFINFFSKKIKVQFNYSCGFPKMFFIVSKIDEDLFWATLHAFSLRFSYWKYFDESDAILAKNMKPIMKSILISPVSLQNEFSIQGNHPENKLDENFNIKLPVLESKIRRTRPELTI